MVGLIDFADRQPRFDPSAHHHHFAVTAGGPRFEIPRVKRKIRDWRACRQSACVLALGISATARVPFFGQRARAACSLTVDPQFAKEKCPFTGHWKFDRPGIVTIDVGFLPAGDAPADAKNGRFILIRLPCDRRFFRAGIFGRKGQRFGKEIGSAAKLDDDGFIGIPRSCAPGHIACFGGCCQWAIRSLSASGSASFPDHASLPVGETKIVTSARTRHWYRYAGNIDCRTQFREKDV